MRRCSAGDDAADSRNNIYNSPSLQEESGPKFSMIFTVKESNQPKKQQQNGNTTKSCVCDDSSESPRGLFFLFCLMNSNDTHTGHTTLTVGPLRAPKVRGGLLFLLLVTVTVVSHNKSYKTVKTTNPLRSKARTLQQASNDSSTSHVR
jgi:hypothetical protein